MCDARHFFFYRIIFSYYRLMQQVFYFFIGRNKFFGQSLNLRDEALIIIADERFGNIQNGLCAAVIINQHYF